MRGGNAIRHGHPRHLICQPCVGRKRHHRESGDPLPSTTLNRGPRLRLHGGDGRGDVIGLRRNDGVNFYAPPSASMDSRLRGNDKRNSGMTEGGLRE